MTESNRHVFTTPNEGQPTVTIGSWLGTARLTDPDDEHRATSERAVIFDRGYRTLLEITGADRADWLHNLTTNVVKTLQPGQGNYCFVLNLQGRILFDTNVLVRPDSIWLDIDVRSVECARAHFDKYIIMEDVHVRDRTADFTRVGLLGPTAAEVLVQLGATNAAPVPYFQVEQVVVGHAKCFYFKHDLCGPSTFDLIVPTSAKETVASVLASQNLAQVVGHRTIDEIRIAHSVPWPVSEINDSILPAETGQMSRAVSSVKGCYLGQEVVERMRARKITARRLVLLALETEKLPAPGSAVLAADVEVGRVTSSGRTPAGSFALAYVKTQHAAAGASHKVTLEAGPIAVTVRPVSNTH